MKNSKHVERLTIWLFLGMGLLPCGTETPFAGRSALAGQPDAGTIIRGQGALAPTGYEEIRCRTDQPQLVLFVAPPDQAVKKGDLVVELDAFALMEKSEEQQIRVMKAGAELTAAIASFPGVQQVAKGTVEIAETALHIAEARLTGYQAGEYPSQKVAAQAEVLIADERAKMLEQRVQEMEATYKEQESQPLLRELLEVRLALSGAKTQATLAQDKLRLLQDLEHPQKTEELKLAIAQRELDLLRARNELARLSREGKASIEDANSIRKMEVRRWERLQNQIAACKLFAPRDGTVFSTNDAALGAPCEPGLQPGDMARPGQVLLRLSDLTQLKLDVRLALPAARKLETGRPATIHVDAFPGRTFRGHLTTLRVLEDFGGAGDPTEAMVTILLDDPVKGLKPGLTATAEFDTPNAQ